MKLVPKLKEYYEEPLQEKIKKEVIEKEQLEEEPITLEDQLYKHVNLD